MASFFRIDWTDPTTGAEYPDAIIRITNWRLQGNPPAAEVDLYMYVDDAALAAQLPFARRLGMPLTIAEMAGWIQAFTLAGYGVLNARAEFLTAVIETV